MPSNKMVLKHSWNAFRNRDPTNEYPISYNVGMSYSRRPDRVMLSMGNEQSIISSIYTRIAIDCAAINFKHARLDENGRYLEEIQSGLNRCLNLAANKDQTGRDFIQDVVMSLLDEGCIAIIPIDTTENPRLTGSFDIQTMRTAKILEWFPNDIRVRVYNDRKGDNEEIVVPKSMAAIIENPLYAVMNEPNSTLKRLVYKLNLLDAIDRQSGSGKLDLILQLPYSTRGEIKKKEAEERLARIEDQLTNHKYGIAYTDATEKIVQLNRPVENNLMDQIEYLTSMLYGQLGLTDEIINGTADEKVMLNYYNRTVEPIDAAICNAMRWKFLTQTARTQGQSVIFYRDPFKLVPVDNLADIADKFTRNEILSSNEMRVVIGYKPADDPRADELRNKNLRAAGDQLPAEGVPKSARVKDDNGRRNQNA